MNPVEITTGEVVHEIPLTVDGAERTRQTAQSTAALERDLAVLKREVVALRQVVAELERKVAKAIAPDEFVEYRGGLFKRKEGGGFHEGVFCPSCHEQMKSPQNELNFNCRSCQSWVNIKGHELPEVMEKVRALKPPPHRMGH